MGLFGFGKKAKEKRSEKLYAEIKAKQPPKPKTEMIKITGMSHYEDDIKSLGYPNDDYNMSKRELAEDYEGEKVYALDFDPTIKLIPEPDNKYDKNAIRVEASGLLIGYVPKNKTARVRALLELPGLISYDAEIHGGKYKLVDDGELIKDEDSFYGDLIFKYNE